ncbi:MAG: N-acetylglucosamine-6-phosphate deacetylase [Chloroherpetonaceae bacterium]|nr:N-acetylglucosamine-6-phosphate deacetylase [Chthonomonadaceae bacterium]MDW8206469.1 N-acetylglucosamine-6-phosphate deacetylase [Chloroherpetonaceae bacterium]
MRTREERWRLLAGRMADARGERASVLMTVQNGRIVEIQPLTGARPESGDVDMRDCLLLPGFIDIHVHGGAGCYLMDGTMDTLEAVAAHLARHGVTGFLPTTITAPWEAQAQVLDVTARALRSPHNGTRGAAVLGCHMEGPYINPKKKGAQPEAFIRPPDVAELQQYVGDNLHAVRVMTLAPEMEGALDLIRFLTAHGVIASIGHTDATYTQVEAAIAVGARHVTHCFNAMRPMESREPGTVGAAFSRPELTAELIWDNVHVHPASCRALVQARRASGVILISDGIPGTDMPDGYTFSLGDLPVTVQNGTARLPDGTLAGSLLTMDRAFQNAAEFSLPERAAMSAYNAAAALGLGGRKGLLSPGYDADFVLLDAGGTVRATFVGGQCVHWKE